MKSCDESNVRVVFFNERERKETAETIRTMAQLLDDYGISIPPGTPTSAVNTLCHILSR